MLFFGGFVISTFGSDYIFVREFGENGTLSNQFYGMNGIAVDRFGHVFVTDVMFAPGQLNSMAIGEVGVVEIKRWSTDGDYQLLWNNSQQGMGDALGIDCSCEGEPFYVFPDPRVDIAKIEHTDPVGILFEDFPDLTWNLGYAFSFIDVAVSADGFVFGTLSRENIGAGESVRSIAKFSWIGSNWVGVALVDVSNEYGNIKNIHAIDVDPWRNKVFVTVLGNEGNASEVLVYDTDLNFVERLALWDYVAQPLGIAVDNRDGSFFICDATESKIQKFSSSGELITSWGEEGTAQSQFNYPTDLDVDLNGYVYVADAGNGRVQVFAPPQSGNLNFIVYKSKVVVKWKLKTKGKNRDVIMAKGFVAVDSLTNIFSGPGSSALNNLPMSFWYGQVPIISNMPPTKTNKKGSRALYKPDKDHKAILVYKEKGALIKFVVKLKKGDVDAQLGITDTASLPPWLWVNAQINLSNNYIGTHYMRLEHKNKVGKVYKAMKK